MSRRSFILRLIAAAGWFGMSLWWAQQGDSTNSLICMAIVMICLMGAA